jgi:hypothetical protein
MAWAVMAMIGTCLPFLQPDGGSSLKTIHFWHLHVHEYQVKWLAAQGGERLLAVTGHDHGVAVLLQDAHRQLLIDDVILGEQEVPL